MRCRAYFFFPITAHTNLASGRKALRTSFSLSFCRILCNPNIENESLCDPLQILAIVFLESVGVIKTMNINRRRKILIFGISVLIFKYFGRLMFYIAL